MTRSVSRPGPRDPNSMVPPDHPRTYYGHPVVKQPVWTWEVPLYFFTGGAAGASALLAFLGRRRGNEELARNAGLVAALAGAASPPLLIADLGVPRRFLNMLRVFKPTSPLSVGSWMLAVFVPAAVGSAILDRLGLMPRVQRSAESAAAALGPILTTYTAVLLADTAIPVWQEARGELPFVFTAGAATSAGAASLLLDPGESASPARRLALAGAVTELVASKVMERRLGELAEPYGEGRAGRYQKAGQFLTAAGAGFLALAGRSRVRARLGASLLLAGTLSKRWSVFRAGFQSAADPKYVVEPQRRRLEGR